MNVIAHCRDVEGIVHLIDIRPEHVETLILATNQNEVLTVMTLCVSHILDDSPLVDVYWVNTDVVPTCVGCVGAHGR